MVDQIRAVERRNGGLCVRRCVSPRVAKRNRSGAARQTDQRCEMQKRVTMLAKGLAKTVVGITAVPQTHLVTFSRCHLLVASADCEQGLRV